MTIIIYIRYKFRSIESSKQVDVGFWSGKILARKNDWLLSNFWTSKYFYLELLYVIDKILRSNLIILSANLLWKSHYLSIDWVEKLDVWHSEGLTKNLILNFEINGPGFKCCGNNFLLTMTYDHLCNFKIFNENTKIKLKNTEI